MVKIAAIRYLYTKCTYTLYCIYVHEYLIGKDISIGSTSSSKSSLFAVFPLVLPNMNLT